MRITIDTESKSINLENDANIEELINFLCARFTKSEMKEYVIVSPVSEFVHRENIVYPNKVIEPLTNNNH